MRILIVEDDPKMSIVLRDALEKRAHRIVLASSGTEGLDIALSHQFEAIILNAMLPQGWMVLLSRDRCATPKFRLL
jgi:DNA-binding response OmpR family regulator